MGTTPRVREGSGLHSRKEDLMKRGGREKDLKITGGKAYRLLQKHRGGREEEVSGGDALESSQVETRLCGRNSGDDPLKGFRSKRKKVVDRVEERYVPSRERAFRPPMPERRTLLFAPAVCSETVHVSWLLKLLMLLLLGKARTLLPAAAAVVAALPLLLLLMMKRGKPETLPPAEAASPAPAAAVW
eukprot:TRINITY_DN3739_c0_g1_i1.p1 TRINITY_DN3739_c0_g1~~TRINITY_DN3739_c0_g1_i1.p1  ORF type:complete len:187 (-),score=34.10 TRINITY_DN3739_c0_g1_i1:382-942(-)